MAALPLVGGAIQAIGAINEGESKAHAAEFNAEQNRKNSDAARAQAADDEIQSRIVSRKAIGDIRASYGASGIQSSEGSALEVLQASAANAEMDALRIKHAGELKSQAYLAGARLNEMEATNSRAQGYLGAASAVIMSAAKYAGSKD